VNNLSDLESMIRALGLTYRRVEGSLVAEYEDKRFGRLGLVFSFDQDTKTVRIAIPLDVEPYEEALGQLLRENFTSTTYKYALDYDGFITVVYDVPADCIDNALQLRELVLYALDGARRILERTEEEQE
jgi:hypothetical protein